MKHKWTRGQAIALAAYCDSPQHTVELRGEAIGFVDVTPSQEVFDEYGVTFYYKQADWSEEDCLASRGHHNLSDHRPDVFRVFRHEAIDWLTKGTVRLE